MSEITWNYLLTRLHPFASLHSVFDYLFIRKIQYGINFQNNKYNGFGIFIDVEGSKFEGKFENGEFMGKAN